MPSATTSPRPSASSRPTRLSETALSVTRHGAVWVSPNRTPYSMELRKPAAGLSKLVVFVDRLGLPKPGDAARTLGHHVDVPWDLIDIRPTLLYEFRHEAAEDLVVEASSLLIQRETPVAIDKIAVVFGGAGNIAWIKRSPLTRTASVVKAPPELRTSSTRPRNATRSGSAIAWVVRGAQSPSSARDGLQRPPSETSACASVTIHRCAAPTP